MKLTADDLLGIINAHEREALGNENGELSNQRAEALKRYFGAPYGDEVEGRSSVISKDVADAVDWIMSSLLRVFLSSDTPIKFNPVGPEDEEQSQQESDYVNHVVMQENEGFMLLHDWFKDALLQKNGYIKHWYDETDEVTHETYSGISLDEIALLMQQLEAEGDDIKIVGQDEQENGTFSIKIQRIRKVGNVIIEPVPPEEIRVSNRCRSSVNTSPFVEHINTKTRSELIEMGLKKDFVDDLPAWNDSRNAYSSESINRDQTSDETNVLGTTIDRSMDEIEFKEAYLRVDFDDDGIAELRRIVVVGNQIPDGEEWNKEIDAIPFSSITPNRIPHRHLGIGLNDELAEIARIKTQLLRLTLDNSYLLTNLEWVINERANVSDFMTTRPGGLKRVTGTDPVDGCIRAVERPPIIQHILPVLDYMDAVKENRTGVGRNMMGLDADTLKKTTEGAARQALQQANAKIEMIARMFAETGMKDMVKAVHALLIKHVNKPKVVRLRNKWIPINPSEWKERTDMTISVGIGTGNMDEVRSNLMLIAELQQQVAGAGVVSPKNIYNLAEKISDQLGFKQKGLFFSDPESPEAQQRQQQAQQGQQGNPLADVEMIKGQFKMQSDQLAMQLKHEHEMHKLEFEKWKFQQEHALGIATEEIKALIAGLKIDLGQRGIGAELQQNAQ